MLKRILATSLSIPILALMNPAIGVEERKPETSVVNPWSAEGSELLEDIKYLQDVQKLNDIKLWNETVARNKRNAQLEQQSNQARQQGQAEIAAPDGEIVNPETNIWVELNGHLCYGECVLSSGSCLIPQYICNHEAMYYNERNNDRPGNTACGKYQFILDTWQRMGTPYPHACAAPEAFQDEMAARLWNNGKGCSHWSAC